MKAWPLARLALRARRRRVFALLTIAALFILAGITARIVGIGREGHVDFDELFRVGGFALPSAILVIGWLLGRFPLIAILVLLAGVASDDRVNGYSRIYGARPVSPLRIYGARVLLLCGVAFAISAVLMPGFDLLMLGDWAGPGTFVLIIAYLFSYGALTVFLSVWTRGDAAITLIIAIVALLWDSLRRADMLSGAPPGTRELITFVLPPQGPLLDLEGAFGNLQPIPWTAFLYVVGYGVVLFILSAVSLSRREV